MLGEARGLEETSDGMDSFERDMNLAWMKECHGSGVMTWHAANMLIGSLEMASHGRSVREKRILQIIQKHFRNKSDEGSSYKTCEKRKLHPEPERITVGLHNDHFDIHTGG